MTSPFRDSDEPPGTGHWLLEIWQTSWADDTSMHYPDTAAVLLADRMIWFTGDEDNWMAIGEPRPASATGFELARRLQDRPDRDQREALDAIIDAYEKRKAEKAWARPTVIAFTREHVRASLQAGGAGAESIPLIQKHDEAHALRPNAESLAVLERWCAWDPPRIVEPPVDVEILKLPVERHASSWLQSLRDRWSPLGGLTVGSRTVAWSGRPNAPRSIGLHEDLRRVLPAGMKLRFEDVGTVASVRRMLATPLFQRAMKPRPFRGRLIRSVDKYISLDARGLYPPEWAGFLLDDQLVLFRGDDRTWNAAADTRGDWVDERASTLAALLVWLPEDEQLAAIQRIVETCEYRFHMLTTRPREDVRRRVHAAKRDDRIPLDDDSHFEHHDLVPTADELVALRAWA